MRSALTALAVSAMALSTVSACAPSAKIARTDADETAAARCFRTDTIRNFRADRQSNLYIRSSRDDVFQINTSGGCWSLDSAISIAVRPTAGGSNNICVGDPVAIVVPNANPGQGSCRAFVTKSLTAEEVAALPDRVRP